MQCSVSCRPLTTLPPYPPAAPFPSLWSDGWGRCCEYDCLPHRGQVVGSDWLSVLPVMSQAGCQRINQSPNSEPAAAMRVKRTLESTSSDPFSLHTDEEPRPREGHAKNLIYTVYILTPPPDSELSQTALPWTWDRGAGPKVLGPVLWVSLSSSCPLGGSPCLLDPPKHSSALQAPWVIPGWLKMRMWLRMVQSPGRQTICLSGSIHYS